MAEKNNKPQFVKSDSFMSDKNYVKWLSDLKSRIRVAQLKAAINVNAQVLLDLDHKKLYQAGTKMLTMENSSTQNNNI